MPARCNGIGRMMPPSLSSEGNRLLAAGMFPEAIQSFERALQSDKVRAHVDGKQVRQTIVVPNKLVNVVV